MRKGYESVVGVIVYIMPAPSLELRNVATGGVFGGLGDRGMQLQMVNENIRCVGRVIIEPRYRGLGLSSWLVKETMPCGQLSGTSTDSHLISCSSLTKRNSKT